MTREWLSREEWAADAERSVRLACFPLERVPARAERYLTADELAERERLCVTLSTAVRQPLTAEIRRLRAGLPSIPPTKPADRSRWYYALAETAQTSWCRMQELEHARREIGRRARGVIDESGYGYSVLTPDVADLVDDQAALARLRELEDAYLARRDQAAEKALRDAITKTVARRNSDEGWATELERRAQIDRGPVLT